MDIIHKCFQEHAADIGWGIKFTFDEYKNFWVNHSVGAAYEMKNRNGSTEIVKVAYYPLPYHKDLYALIEVMDSPFLDLREVPVRYLTQKQNQ